MRGADHADIEREALAILSGDGAGDFLRLALSDFGRIATWSLHTINHRPGAGVSAGYSVVFDDGDRSEYVIATTAKINELRLRAGGGVTLRAGERRLHVWVHPADPELPALALACDPDALSEWIGARVDIELLGYRPTRRAVVRVSCPGKKPIFAKVLRPDAATELVSRLEMLERSAVPAPRLLASDESGLVVTSSRTGVPLSKLYTGGNAENSHQMVARLDELLDSLPPLARGLRRRPAWMDRCEHYANAAAIALPDEEERIRQLARDIRRLESLGDFGPIVATHGDFYEANILVDPNSFEVTGLLDVDNIGPGHRVNDWGCLLGHLSVLPGLSTKRYGQATQILRRWAPLINSRVDPVALCASSAGTVLSLIAGARKSRQKNWQDEARYRLTTAEQWIRFGDEAIDAA